MVMNAQRLIDILMRHFMPKHFNHFGPRLFVNESTRKMKCPRGPIPAAQPPRRVVYTQRRGPHGPLELSVVEFRPPPRQLSDQGGIHIGLLTVFGAVAFVLLKSIADTIAAPVAARRRRGTVAGTEIRVILFGVVALAVATWNLCFVRSQARR